MNQFANLMKIGKIALKVFKALLAICLLILAAAVILFIWLSIPSFKKDIENARLPTEIVEVPPGTSVNYLKIGGWLLSQEFVIINPPGIFGDYKEWIRQYDREHPFDPELIKELLEKEKNAKTDVNTDKYTDEQKKDNRVTYRRTFYRESRLTPRDWDGMEQDDSYKYREHILMYTNGFIEGFDKVEWPVKKEAEE